MFLKVIIILGMLSSIANSAELLVKAVDATNPDPIEDARGCYKTGDVVVVMPDGHEWGKEEGLPKFQVIKVPGLSVADAKVKYLKPEGEPNNQARRRAYKVDVREVRKKEVAGAIKVSELEACIINKATNKTVSQEKLEANLL